MDRIIQTSTEKYLNKLDSNREYHTPVQLLEAGLPDYLVQRIRMELIRNLQDSVKPPASDWANMNAGAVKYALDQFLKAIRDEIRLPSSHAGSVLESALSDILELLVTPRAFLPDYLFGSEQTLDLAQVRERCEWIVVYRYFSSAIPRFMEKKGRDKLTREQADRIIERLDERVTSQYTSLNWGQLFEPWFTLIGESVDPSLFAAFFRDKGKPGVARLFDAEPEPIHRTRLIEILSRPQFYDDDDDLSDIAAFNTREKRPAGTEDSERTFQNRVKPKGVPAVEASRSSKMSDEPGYARTSNAHGSASEEDSTVGTGLDAAGVNDASKRGTPDRKTKGTSDESDINKDTGAHTDADSEEENLLGRFRKTNGGDTEEQPLYSRLKKETPNDEENRPLHINIKRDSKSDSSDEIPIWQRFTKVRSDTSDEDKTETVKERAGASARSSEKSGGTTAGSKPDLENDTDFLTKYRSVYNSDFESESEHSSKSEPDSGTKSGIKIKSEPDSDTNTKHDQLEIRTYVSDLEQEFVDELFGGDENAFLDALEEIERCNEWKQAGKYISKEIFDRNMIDIYSDTAIYFTDRMQTYFLERTL